MEWSTLRDCLAALARTEPLVMEKYSLAELPEKLSCPPAPTSVYFGIGLTSKETISQGLPFDMLSMLFIAEKYREATRAETTICLIADSHALANLSVTRENIEKTATQTALTITRIGKKLALPIEVIRASKIDNDKTYLEGLRQTNGIEIESELREYARRELADIFYLKHARGLVLKLGWALDGNGFDERFFDEAFRNAFPEEPMLFAYVEAGRTLDPTRPKAPPYICTNPHHRLLLELGEQVGRKLQTAARQNGKVVGYLEKVVALCAQHPALAHTQELPLTDQIQAIITTLCS